jgi:hypothetical protein
MPRCQLGPPDLTDHDRRARPNDPNPNRKEPPPNRNAPIRVTSVRTSYGPAYTSRAVQPRTARESHAKSTGCPHSQATPEALRAHRDFKEAQDAQAAAIRILLAANGPGELSARPLRPRRPAVPVFFGWIDGRQQIQPKEHRQLVGRLNGPVQRRRADTPTADTFPSATATATTPRARTFRPGAATATTSTPAEGGGHRRRDISCRGRLGRTSTV